MNIETPHPELNKLIGEIAIQRRHGVLREFACWCARQMGPISGDNARLVAAAERCARGEISVEQLCAGNDSLGGSLAAACLIGVHKCHDPAAAVRLVCGATNNAKAYYAATEAAKWMRAWVLLYSRRAGVPMVDEEQRLEEFARLQLTALKLIASRPDHVGPLTEGSNEDGR